MWNRFGRVLLRNKLGFLISLLLLTVFMGYRASRIELSYEYAKVLPQDDPAFIDYNHFKNMFGEDGNVMVIGVQDPDFFTLEKFNGWYKLTNDIKKLEGIQEVLSYGNLYTMTRNDSLQKFDFKQLMTAPLTNQESLD
jgi:uncharacterized protein